MGNNLNEPSSSSHQYTPVDVVTVLSDPSSPDIHSFSSTDESLRIAIDNYDGNTVLDSELFNAKLENFIRY